jgi:hypothetical protein
VTEETLQSLRVEAVRILSFKRLGISMTAPEAIELLARTDSVSGALRLMARFEPPRGSERGDRSPRHAAKGATLGPTSLDRTTTARRWTAWVARLMTSVLASFKKLY